MATRNPSNRNLWIIAALVVLSAAILAWFLGSGSLPVLGTPRLLAWCEATTCAALAPALQEGQTSVGTRMPLISSRRSMSRIAAQQAA